MYKMFSFIKILGQSREIVAPRGPALLSVNYLNKRNAGHSEAANRKGVKEASNKRKSAIIEKLRKSIYNEIMQSKKTNVETNPRLKAILNEAHKASIPVDALQKFIKNLESLLNNDKIESYVFEHSLGIFCIVDLSIVQGIQTKNSVQCAFKKYGFKCLGLNDQFKLLGNIYCKPLKHDSNNLEKALEDAILANCEEVLEKDDGYFEFTCNGSELDNCKKILEENGYEVQTAEKTYAFTSYIKVDDWVLQQIDKIHDRLENIGGFIKLSHNISNRN